MSLEEAPFLNLHKGALWEGPPYRALPSSSCLPGDRVESNSGVLASPGPRPRPASSPSQVKSWMATSWMGISLRKNGFWHRGFPLTTRLFLSHLPSQARWQLQLKGLDRRFLGGEKGPLWVVTRPPGELAQGPCPATPGPSSPAVRPREGGRRSGEGNADSSKTQMQASQRSFLTLANGREPGPAVRPVCPARLAELPWAPWQTLSPLGPHTRMSSCGAGSSWLPGPALLSSRPQLA